MKDYYQILGIGEKADLAEVKKAYRRLAREHHPDRNPDKPDSESRFKEVQEAYDTLSDEKKRREYDRLRRNPFAGRERSGDGFSGFQDFRSRGGSRFYRAPDGSFVRVDEGAPAEGFGEDSFGGLGDIFSRFFGGEQEAQSPPADPGATSREVRVRLPFATALTGGTVRVKLPDGKSVRLTVPKGVQPGYRVRLKGKGAPTRDRGQIIVIFDVEEHPDFRRIGDDLYMNVEITAFEALFGTTRNVSNPYGTTIKLTIPKGTQPAEKLRIRGQGVETEDGRTGDLYVEISVIVPRNLSPRQLEILRRAADEAGLG